MSKLRIVKQRSTRVSVGQPSAPVQARSTPMPDANDPRSVYLARVAQDRERREVEDERLRRRNSDVTRLDDVPSKIDGRDLVRAFDTGRTDLLKALVGVLTGEIATKSAVQDTQVAVRSIIGESIDIDVTRLSKLLEGMHELALLQTLSTSLGLEPEVRARMLMKHIDKEWGPKPVEGRAVHVSVPNNTNSGAAASNRRQTTERPSNEPEGAPRGVSRSRGGGMSPFGAIPS